MMTFDQLDDYEATEISLQQVREGKTRPIREFLEELRQEFGFPDLTAEDIQACFAFAADRERRLAVIPYEAAVRRLLEAARRKIPPQKMRLISLEPKR